MFDVMAPGLTNKVLALREYYPTEYDSWKTRFNLVEGSKFHYGKITRIPDKEGKTRVITILNYWTQNALKPLHDACSSALKMFP